jgi:hypothetical protein
MPGQLFQHRSRVEIPALDPFVASNVLRVGGTVDGILIVWIGKHCREYLLPINEGLTRPVL